MLKLENNNNNIELCQLLYKVSALDVLNINSSI